jgi:hypothetical protein
MFVKLLSYFFAHSDCIFVFLFIQGQIYGTVVDDVISNFKEAFLDEGVDEQVLQELRQVISFIIFTYIPFLHICYHL